MTAAEPWDRFSHWNYRVRSRATYPQAVAAAGVEPEVQFDLIETYYDHDGNVLAWSAVTGPLGDSVADLVADLDAMRGAVNRPVLADADLPRHGDDDA